MKYLTLSRILLSLAPLISLFGCDKNAETRPILRNVVLTTPVSTSGISFTDYPGIIEEGASVSAAFMADGKIGKIYAKEGERVKAGQLLAILDDSDYKIGVTQLETQLSQMTGEKERMDAMFAKHNIAPNDYEKFQAGYKQLELQLEMAKRQLDYTRLYSPVAGFIASSYLHEGELAGAGTHVFNIVDDSHLVASVDVPVNLYLIRNDIISVNGKTPSIAGNIPLKILSFTPDADNSMLYKIKLSIPGEVAKKLSPGMNISVQIQTSSEKNGEWLIPSRAIISENGKNFVWIYNPEDSTINHHHIMIEGKPIGKMNVVRGVSDGMEIVETGVKQLYDGEKVNVLNRKDLGL